MGELHVNMNITLDGVIQANGGPHELDGDFPYAGWERPYGDAESGAQIIADVQASDALLLGRTTLEVRAAAGSSSGVSGAAPGRPGGGGDRRPPRGPVPGAGALPTLVAPAVGALVLAAATGNPMLLGLAAVGPVTALVGAAAFVVSDSILGWGKFVGARRWTSVAVMMTYHVALGGLALAL